jgi:uncharacterized membrane protein
MAIDDFFGRRGQRYDRPLTPTTFERMIGLLALILLGFALAAVLRGRPHWGEIPSIVWAHLATILLALALTPVLLWRKRGDRWHRRMGWVWTVSMLVTALLSFQIRLLGHGGFSVIHLLSAWTVVGVPVIVLAARRHDIKRHRGMARGFVVGALLAAGFFTFPFDRLLGSWLFG